MQHILLHMLPVVTSLKIVLEANKSHLQVRPNNIECPIIFTSYLSHFLFLLTLNNLNLIIRSNKYVCLLQRALMNYLLSLVKSHKVEVFQVIICYFQIGLNNVSVCQCVHDFFYKAFQNHFILPIFKFFFIFSRFIRIFSDTLSRYKFTHTPRRCQWIRP